MSTDLGEMFESLSGGLADAQEYYDKFKATTEQAFALLDSMGFGIIEATTAREPDGAWRVNGKLYPAADSTFGERLTDERVKNGDLPDWFPFAELVQSGLAFEAWKRQPENAKLAPASKLDPEFLASMLIDWVLAGATLEELEQIAPADGAYGLRGDPNTDPALARQMFAALPLLAAINSRADVAAFNAVFDELFRALSPWQQGEKPPYTICMPTSNSALKLGELDAPSAGGPGCTGVVFADDKSIVSTYDEQGRWVRPWKGDFAKRAKAMIQFLRTGEVMSMSADVSNFASFSDCVLSGDQACLTNYPTSANFWQRLNEPWREGYKPDGGIQIVENRFGRFLAWKIGDKPRGISLNVALAISAPLVLGLATIGVSAWYFSKRIK